MRRIFSACSAASSSRQRLTLFVALFLSLAMISGCSTTIHLRSGESFTGDVERSDADHVYLSNSEGGLDAIPRDQIEEVEHAGTDAAWTGGIMAGVGLAGALVTGAVLIHEEAEQGACQTSDDCESYVGMVTLALVGLPSASLLLLGGGVLAGGLLTRERAVSEFEPPQDGTVTLSVAPWGDVRRSGEMRGGLGLSVTF